MRNFIGVVQVLVYAGAVMVLFLFIIMLLDLRAEKRPLSTLTFIGASAVLVAFGAVLIHVTLSLPIANMPMPPLVGHAFGDDVAAIGMAIFRNYNLPLQIIGVLLLVATVGA